jgi:hypothetical protein
MSKHTQPEWPVTLSPRLEAKFGDKPKGAIPPQMELSLALSYAEKLLDLNEELTEKLFAVTKQRDEAMRLLVEVTRHGEPLWVGQDWMEHLAQLQNVVKQTQV